MKVAEKNLTVTFSVLKDGDDRITVALNRNYVDELTNRIKAIRNISVNLDS